MIAALELLYFLVLLEAAIRDRAVALIGRWLAKMLLLDYDMAMRYMEKLARNILLGQTCVRVVVIQIIRALNFMVDAELLSANAGEIPLKIF